MAVIGIGMNLRQGIGIGMNFGYRYLLSVWILGIGIGMDLQQGIGIGIRVSVEHYYEDKEEEIWAD